MLGPVCATWSQTREKSGEGPEGTDEPKRKKKNLDKEVEKPA